MAPDKETNNSKWFREVRAQAEAQPDAMQYILDRLFYRERENRKLNFKLESFRNKEGKLPLILEGDTTAAFVELLRNIMLERNQDKLFDTIVNGLNTVFKYERVGLMLYNETTREIDSVKNIGLPKEYIDNLGISPTEITGEKMRNYVARCFTKRKTFFVTDRFDDDDFNQRMQTPQKVYSPQYAVIPIYGQEKTFGVFTIATTADKDIFLTNDDLVFLEFFSNQVGIALENVALNNKLEKFYKDLISTFSNLVEFRDECTAGHCTRLMAYADIYSDRLSFDDATRRELELAAALHDIGKLGVPDAILNKPGKLTETEYEEIKKHSERGSEIARPLSDYTKVVAAIKHHHERWDGKGYPDGMAKAKIPLLARIVSIIDTFDVIINDRPYKKAMSIEEAKAEIEKCSGIQFDPFLAKILLSVPNEQIEQLQAFK